MESAGGSMVDCRRFLGSGTGSFWHGQETDWYVEYQWSRGNRLSRSVCRPGCSQTVSYSTVMWWIFEGPVLAKPNYWNLSPLPSTGSNGIRSSGDMRWVCPFDDIQRKISISVSSDHLQSPLQSTPWDVKNRSGNTTRCKVSRQGGRVFGNFNILRYKRQEGPVPLPIL
jgi:hypothetical protein